MLREKQIENMEEACRRILELSAFGISWEEKENRYVPYMKRLTEYHRNHCKSYGRILQILKYEDRQTKRLYDLPMIPVSLFKEFDLSSVEEEQVFKILSSSGTTGQFPARITLDSRTADLQQQILYKIVKGFMASDSEKGRFPMLILDSQSVLKDIAF
ncbi:hypothetical protein AALB16_07180 [Lachnospiraceae bacterium 62-35]